MTLTAVVLTNATIVALLATAVRVAERRSIRPALAHVCWVAVLIKLFLPPLLVVPILLPATGADTAALSFAAQAATTTLKSAPAPSPPTWNVGVVTALAALAGAFLVLIVSAFATINFRRRLRSGRPAPPELVARVAELSRTAGLRREPRVRLVDAPVTPLLWGLAPVLVVPAPLVELLTGGELDALLLHELVHLRRRDHWVRLLELGARVLYWWHPAVWWTVRRLRRAEERACDARVLEVLPTARAYADGLLKTVTFLSGTRRGYLPLASGATEAEDLKGRLIMIMNRNRSEPSLPTPARLAFALLVVIGLTLFPAWAQSPAEGNFTLSAQNQPLIDVLSQMASHTELNWIIHPSVPIRQTVTVELEDAPLSEALDALLEGSGVTYTRSANVVEIHPRELVLKRSADYSGQPIDVNVRNAPLRDVIDLIAEETGLDIELPEGIDSDVTLNLQGVAWDLALEVVLTLNDLTYTAESGVVQVAPQA